MRREKTATMFPEQRPDLFAVRLRQRQRLQFGTAEKSEFPFGVLRGKFGKPRFDFEEEHQPMRGSAIAMLGNDSDQMEIGRSNAEAKFLGRFAAGAGIGRFAVFDLHLAAGWTPESAIRLASSLQQEHV